MIYVIVSLKDDKADVKGYTPKKPDDKTAEMNKLSSKNIVKEKIMLHFNFCRHINSRTRPI